MWPAGLLPLIGAAYSRAREYTCDLHGAACCVSPEDGRRALAALAAVAIPAYSDYTARAQVSEGLSLAAPAKGCIEQFYSDNQTVPTANEDCSLTPDQVSGKYTESVTISDGGFVTILFRNSGVAATIAGQTIEMQASLDDQGRIVWDCRGGSLESRFRPSACR